MDQNADRGQRAGLQNISQREAYGVLNTSGIALVPWVLTDKTDGWIFHEDRSHNNIIQRGEMSRGNSKYIKEMCVIITLKLLWWIKWSSADCEDEPTENYHSTTAPLSSALLRFEYLNSAFRFYSPKLYYFGSLSLLTKELSPAAGQ